MSSFSLVCWSGTGIFEEIFSQIRLRPSFALSRALEINLAYDAMVLEA